MEEEDYTVFYRTGGSGTLAYQFEIADGTTHVWLKVQAIGYADTATNVKLVSQSNVIAVERLTVDAADYLYITSVEYDS